MSPGSIAACSRHHRAASTGSSHVENGTACLPCLRRENRSSSAAATICPSITSAAAGSWNTALIPRILTQSPLMSLQCHGYRRLCPPLGAEPIHGCLQPRQITPLWLPAQLVACQRDVGAAPLGVVLCGRQEV